MGDSVRATRTITWVDDAPGFDAKHSVGIGETGRIVHEGGANDAGPTVDFGDGRITTALPGEVEPYIGGAP
jgi:hypothetical protein